MARQREKNSTDDYRTLNISALKRESLLRPGISFEWSWWRRGEKVASIGIAIENRHGMRLRYRSSRYKSEPVQHDYPVTITWTPCHLGGERPWFLCPSCGRRVAKLYNGGVFACRHCMRLNYTSQQTNKLDRPCDHSWKLRRALGCNDGFLFTSAECIAKPKGMHWRTFGRKISRIRETDDRAMKVLLGLLCPPESATK